MDFISCGIPPDDLKEATSIKRMADQFFYKIITKILYRKLYDGILFHFLSWKETQAALQ